MCTKLLILCSLAFVASMESELETSLNQFFNVIDEKDLHEVICDATKDEQVMAMLNYTKSDEFQQLITNVQNMDDYKTIINELRALGLDIMAYLNKLYDKFVLTESKTAFFHLFYLPKSDMENALKRILRRLPADRLQSIYNIKMYNEWKFISAVKIVDSPFLYRIVDRIEEMQQWKDFIDYMESIGVNTMNVMKLIHDHILKIIDLRHFYIYSD